MLAVKTSAASKDQLSSFLEALEAKSTPLDVNRLQELCLSYGRETNAPSCVPNELRRSVYHWLLLGSSQRHDIPFSFEAYLSSRPAVNKAASVDVEVLLTDKFPCDSDNASGPATNWRKELEGLFEYFCAKTKRQYQRALCEVCGVLLSVRPLVTFPQLFGFLYCIVEKYIPNERSCDFSEATTALLRLLLQYHDPALCMHFDHHLVSIECVAKQWLDRLFIPAFDPLPACGGQQPQRPSEEVPGIILLWDWLFVLDNPAFSCFLVLSILTSERERLLKAQGKEDVTRCLQSIRVPSTAVRRVVACARDMMRVTPSSVIPQLKDFLFPAVPGAGSPVEAAPDPRAALDRLMQCVVITVSPSELISTFAVRSDGITRPSSLHQVVLDCRAEKSYHFARLPTALHIGNEIGFDPVLLRGMLSRFEKARGSHFCILGTGRGILEEVNLLKIIALQFVQAGFPYIAVAEGGFRALIPAIRAGALEVVRSTPSSPQQQRTPVDGSSATVEMCAEPSPERPPKKEKSDNHSFPSAATTTKAEDEPLRKKAEAIKEKAAEGLEAAKVWGAGLMRRFLDKDKPPKSTSSPQLSGGEQGSASAASAEVGGSQETAGSKHATAPTAATKNAAGVHSAPSAPSQPIEEQPRYDHKKLFKFEEHDDEEEFGLITTVATLPVSVKTKTIQRGDGDANISQPDSHAPPPTVESVKEPTVATQSHDAANPAAASSPQAEPAKESSVATSHAATDPAPTSAQQADSVSAQSHDAPNSTPASAPQGSKSNGASSSSQKRSSFEDLFGV